MLVVDVVELVAEEEVRYVLELDEGGSIRREKVADAAEEIVKVRDVSDHVVRDDEVGPALADIVRHGPPEGAVVRRYAIGLGCQGHIAGGLYAEDLASVGEVLKEGPVV